MPANESGGPRGLRHWSQFIIRSSPTGVITLDYQGRINDINPAAEALTGYSREEALGMSCEQVLPCETLEKHEKCPIEAVVRDQKKNFSGALAQKPFWYGNPGNAHRFPFKRRPGGLFGRRDHHPGFDLCERAGKGTSPFGEHVCP